MTSRKPSKRPPARASGVQLGEIHARGMILTGAAVVFAEHGARAASIEMVLEAAGVSRRTFYRLYENKEAVMLALYRMGTERLLDLCRQAVSEEAVPMRKIERCIDTHLRNARDLGRLVFVLGGEAQRRESVLHARRIEVHEALVAMFADAMEGELGGDVDPLLFRALILALEGVTRIVLEEGDEGRAVDEASIERARRVMLRMASASFAATGKAVAPLPRRS